MFSLPSESDEPATYHNSFSPASGSDDGNSRSGSQSPSEGTTLASTLASKTSRKRRAQLSRINLANGADPDEGDSPSTSSGNQPAESDGPSTKIRLTSLSSSASSGSLFSLASEGSQTSLNVADSCYDVAEQEYGQNTPSAVHNPPAQNGTIIGDGEYMLLGSGKECKTFHIPTGILYHCVTMNRSEYDTFMSVAERIETAKNRLTSEEYDELRRLLMPEELQVVRGSAGLWYVISPDHQGSLQTSYNAGHSSCINRNNSPWSEQECKVIFRQIVRLVAHCHRIGIYFGDFRLTKLVYSDKQRHSIRVLHFHNIHVAPQIDNDIIEKPSTKIIPAFSAPEVIKLDQYGRAAADIWSLGVLLVILLTGRYPFKASQPAALARLIRMGQFSFLQTDKVSRLARMLTYGLLRMNPSDRPSAREILMFEWLQNDGGDLSKNAQARPAANIRIFMPENVNSNDSQIPAQLLNVLSQGVSARNQIYNTNSEVRASVEVLVSSLSRNSAPPKSESNDHVVPEWVDEDETDERDSLGITVIRTTGVGRPQIARA